MNEDADFLDQLQRDAHGILAAAPQLRGARVLLDNQGDMESRVENELGTMAENGRGGLAVIVLAAEVESVEENLPGPPMTVLVHVQCIEHVELNRSRSDGTGLRSTAAAVRVLGALHHVSLGNHVLTAAPRKPVVPMKLRDGYVGHLVTLRVLHDGLSEPRVGPVEMSFEDDLVHLDCGTAGAEIRYTLDGSYPFPSGRLYTAPFAMPEEGTRIRAAAIAPNLNPSDVAEETIA